jgi:hypothetical protein
MLKIKRSLNLLTHLSQWLSTKNRLLMNGIQAMVLLQSFIIVSSYQILLKCSYGFKFS